MNDGQTRKNIRSLKICPSFNLDLYLSFLFDDRTFEGIFDVAAAG
jgi:hypothetical protein